ncbi:MAG: helix-turn-helix domain-containing protein [Defluviitaleaceae bacterium]|nr:helix-turn-helix domain-containing protein [Defluviitaleaceae bacterium]
MTNIAGMPAGIFIKKVRKQRRLSQQELAIDILDRTLISRLEKGKYMPPYDKLAQLVERLGFGADIIGTDERQWKGEIEGLLSRRETDLAERLIDKLENDDGFISNEINRQFLIVAKVAAAIIKKEIPGKIFAFIRKGLSITIPFFNEKYIEDYLLTGNDIQLINQLTITYWDTGERDKAIDLMMALIRNFDKSCADLRYRSQHYPTLVYNLTSYLRDMKRNEEALHLCDMGIVLCLSANALFTLPLLISNKACCLLDMNNRDESLHLFRQSFYLFDAYRMFDHKETERLFVKDNFGISL